MVVSHADYHKSHRIPRILIVANDEKKRNDGAHIFPSPELITVNLDCSCLKFMAPGQDNVHVLIPAKYEKDPLQSVKDVVEQSIHAQRPYDLIIVDSEWRGKEIARYAESLSSKPGVVIYVSDVWASDQTVGTTTAEDLRNRGIAAFNRREMLVKPDDTQPSIFDQQVELALGEEGIRRLECQPSDSASAQWSTLMKQRLRYREVTPSDAVLCRPIGSAELQGHG